MDKSIILAASKGDKKSYKMIFEYYLPRMRPVALRYARSSLESEDILQDSFIKIYKKLSTYSFKGDFEGWIRTIVVNTALNYYKKNRNTYLHQSDSILFNKIEVEEEEDKLKDLDSDTILEAISELPEGYKIIFNLYIFEGYSHKHISEMLGIAEVTSRTQLFKARELLKKILIKATK